MSNRTEAQQQDIEQLCKILQIHGIRTAKASAPGNRSDVEGVPRVLLKVRTQKGLPIRRLVSDTQAQARLNGDAVGIVAHRAPGQPWSVTMDALDFVRLYSGDLF